MPNVHVKKIERLLKKEGVDVHGLHVVDSISDTYIAEAINLGMTDGITESYEFTANYSITGGSLTFYGNMVEDYRKVSPDQEVAYYYPHLDSCEIQLGNTVKSIDLDVYWK